MLFLNTLCYEDGHYKSDKIKSGTCELLTEYDPKSFRIPDIYFRGTTNTSHNVKFYNKYVHIASFNSGRVHILSYCFIILRNISLCTFN